MIIIIIIFHIRVGVYSYFTIIARDFEDFLVNIHAVSPHCMPVPGRSRKHMHAKIFTGCHVLGGELRGRPNPLVNVRFAHQIATNSRLGDSQLHRQDFLGCASFPLAIDHTTLFTHFGIPLPFRAAFVAVRFECMVSLELHLLPPKPPRMELVMCSKFGFRTRVFAALDHTELQQQKCFVLVAHIHLFPFAVLQFEHRCGGLGERGEPLLPFGLFCIPGSRIFHSVKLRGQSIHHSQSYARQYLLDHLNCRSVRLNGRSPSASHWEATM